MRTTQQEKSNNHKPVAPDRDDPEGRNLASAKKKQSNQKIEQKGK